MNGVVLRALIVDDNPDDATLLEMELRAGGYEPRVVRVQTAASMLAALESETWDIVLSDYTMPKFNALEALEVLKSTDKDIPFIMISGSVGEELAVRAMKAGAHDYFMKGHLGLLVSAIRRELRESELRRKSREQREQLLQNEKLAAMGTLAAGVAHELNNPLAVVMAQAELLKRMMSPDDPRQVKSDKILEAAERCARIVRDFLSLARQQPPERRVVSLNEVVEQVMKLLATGLRVDDVELRLHLVEPLPSVWADPHQLEQVVINLVTNAQYELRSRPAPRILEVVTSSDTESKRVMLRVTDNGRGIPPDVRSRIFEPFFTTKIDGQGTGLGLALCHGIVNAHEGTITVESEVGAGATFRIDLPIGSNADRTVVVADSVAPAIGRKRILVVDDQPEVANALFEVLNALGHSVAVAEDGKSALQMLDEAPFDLVISDMRMPEVDGPTLYRRAIARHPAMEKRFVFLTGDTFRPETEKFLRETQAVYLNKPCTFEEIASAVEKVFA